MRTVIPLALAGLLVLPACGSAETASSPAAPAADAPLAVVASFYPLQWVAERLTGAPGAVTSLTPTGTEPHSLAIEAPGRQALDDADTVLYLGNGFQPDVERALASLGDDVRAVDLLRAPGVELLPAPTDLGKELLAGGEDPHVWLDPQRMKSLAQAASEAIVAADPESDPARRDAVQGRLSALLSDLDTLDEELAAALRSCDRRTIVTSHAAFGYLADRYDLEQIAIAGLSAEAEPDPRTLQQIAERAERAGVTTVFFEEALPPRLAETVAAEIGARTDLLGALEFDPEEAVGPGEDYLSVQRRNGRALAAGLGCST